MLIVEPQKQPHSATSMAVDPCLFMITITDFFNYSSPNTQTIIPIYPLNWLHSQLNKMSQVKERQIDFFLLCSAYSR